MFFILEAASGSGSNGDNMVYNIAKRQELTSVYNGSKVECDTM